MRPKEALEQLDEIIRVFGEEVPVDYRDQNGEVHQVLDYINWGWEQVTVKDLRDEVSLQEKEQDWRTSFHFHNSWHNLDRMEMVDGRLQLSCFSTRPVYPDSDAAFLDRMED